jgi:ACS family hexuronate transporter-like MFS transporter
MQIVQNRKLWIAVMLFLISTINSVDRLVLASVAPILRDTFHLSNQQYSYIVIAFMAGMALGQVPAGAMLDRIGVRFGLPILLVGWSFFNMLHVLARQVAQFCILRLGMGVFESGNYSGGLKAISQTIPAERRGFALGFFNTGYLLGSVLAPPLVVYTATRFGWKSSFLLPGLIGMIWILPWLAIYARPPESLPAQSEPAARPALRDILRLRNTWGVIALRSSSGPVTQFYWYWLPLYLVRGRGASIEQMAGFASIAYVIGACGNLAGGSASDWLVRNGMAAAKSRRITFVVGAILCSLCTFLVIVTKSLLVSDLFAGVAIFGLNFASCALLAMMSDMFPEAALARVCGLSGVGENLLAIILTLCTGIILDRFSFDSIFGAASLFPLISVAMLYLLIRAPEVAPVSIPRETTCPNRSVLH